MKLRITLLIAALVGLFGVGVTPSHAGGLYNIAFSLSKTTLVAGETFTMTATVTDMNGAPLPSTDHSYITILLDGHPGVGAELANGKVTFAYLYPAFGTHIVQARYCGPDNTCNGDSEDVTSNPISITVTKANSSMSVVAPDQALAGHLVPIAITVSPVFPASNSYCSNGFVKVSTDQYTGQSIAVKITVDSSGPTYATLQSVAGTCSGKVSVNKSFSVGTHKVVISYPGSNDFNASGKTFFIDVSLLTN